MAIEKTKQVQVQVQEKQVIDLHAFLLKIKQDISNKKANQ